ncbi:hypothetical protein AGABI2DRAFT_204147 [Agaricus bisporus var. bisporus H97]|uniref:hypothetical protein n=1 Tax=Agaricus bisporus var. bisporus (strain H97 / ATCC MYA-4626 / FGSC 10389) TaxID=936046 RepID=UPI00029F69C0|nr:hypothetical protein AGABI2DRAFT_204147 [Agaricus bisporus var. bisporus H97]EKV47214.1 hypothetical protein AGABI2DRAFT_204147 [Agaricus bisporus var. bisporus H97]
MSASAIVCRPSLVLGKRRADDVFASPSPSICSRSSASSEQHQSRASSSKTGGPVIINGKLQPSSEKRYQCTYKGCNKAYSKPSRLAEHERSHTGERPFRCEICNKSYLRETHLHAHARSHLPESSRPFICDKSGCEKRFWTTQHLKVHLGWHDGVKPFTCSEPGCTESFAKHHQLRSHAASAHSPPGTKSYRCDHVSCTKSFSTNQQLKAHIKTHDERRYTCVHGDCITASDQSPLYFSTWSTLQNHIRNAHPPTCTHASCAGRSFTTQRGLRAHMKLHEEHDMMEAFETLHDEDDSQPTKKRRGGDWGRDWKCDYGGCSKDFKSKSALTVHKNVAHLGQRNFACSYEDCHKAFGYNHLLQRHVAKVHRTNNDTDTEFSDEESLPSPGAEQQEANISFDINAITGYSYIQVAQTKVAEKRALQCPFPDLHPFVAEVNNIQPSTAPSKQINSCDYIFTRAYDLRRHLRASHQFSAQKDSVEDWVAQKKLAWYT